MSNEASVTSSSCIILDPIVYSKIINWTYLAQGEISALGLVHITDRDFFVYGLFLLPQECSKGDTEINSEEVNRLIYELKKDNTPVEDLRFWWHSHGEMKGFWSSQDRKTMEILENPEFLVSLVTSKSNGDCKFLFNLQLYYPIEISIDNMPFRVSTPELDEFCLNELENKVKTKTYKPTVKKGGLWDKWPGISSDELPEPNEVIFSGSLFNGEFQKNGFVEEEDDALTEQLDEIETKLLTGSEKWKKSITTLHQYFNSLPFALNSVDHNGAQNSSMEEVYNHIDITRNFIQDSNLFTKEVRSKIMDFLNNVYSKGKPLYFNWFIDMFEDLEKDSGETSWTLQDNKT